MPYLPTATDFLPSLATATTPTGKKIYVAAIGMNRLTFKSKVPVQWAIVNLSGTVVGYLTQQPNTQSPPVNNTFVFNNEVLIEYDIPTTNYHARATLNGTNFDLTPLEQLPSVAQMNAEAEANAASAKDVYETGQLSYFDQVFKSIFGTTGKQAITYLGIGIGVVLILPYLFKKK